MSDEHVAPFQEIVAEIKLSLRGFDCLAKSRVEANERRMAIPKRISIASTAQVLTLPEITS